MLLSAFIISLTVDNKIGCAILKNVVAFPCCWPAVRNAFGALVLSLWLGVMPGATHALAQPTADTMTWPTRTVRFIVSLGPGSGADIGGRLVADRWSTSEKAKASSSESPIGDHSCGDE